MRTSALGNSAPSRDVIGGHAEVNLDGGSRARVLLGQPGVGQVKVDAGRLVGEMAGLSLHSLEGHTHFTQPSQAGMT